MRLLMPAGRRPFDLTGRLRGILPVCLALASLWVCGAQAQSSQNWRVYTAVNGLRESFARAVSVGPGGKVWVTHGRVDRMTVLDGYTCRQFPSPGANLKVKESPDGTLWAFTGDGWPTILTGLQRYREDEGRWESWDDPAIKTANLTISGNFEPLDRNRALFLLPDSLMQFDAAGRKSSVVATSAGLGRFLYLTSAADGGVWIGAELGLGRYRPGLPDPWREIPLPAGLRGLTNVRDQGLGELFASARDAGTGSSVLLLYRGGQWQVLHRARTRKETVQGWRSPEGGFWVALTQPESFSLVRVHDLGMQEEKNKAISGSLMDVATELDGTFWIGTSLGLAHYAALPWRTPIPVSDLEEAVTSIVEDSRGRIYFLYLHRLVVLDGDRWKRYELPDGRYVPGRMAHAMVLLPDGRLTIPTNGPDLLLFDPGKERFEYAKHPKGDAVRVICPAKGGTAWIATPTTDGQDYRLETFDGRTFQTRLSVRSRDISVTRSVYETSSGDLWVMGQGGDGIGLWRNGRLRTFRKEDGFLWDGSFVALERPERKIWFGDRAGVLEYDGNNWTVLHSDTETVRAMVTGRDGSVWVASGSGIHRYYQGSWVGIRVSDGIPDAGAVAVFEDSRGRIWVGSTRGVSLYYPDADRKPPRTFIPEENNLRKSPPGGEVHFVFAGIDHWQQTEEVRLMYSYRVDGQEWTPYISEEKASIRGLSAGQHSFEVRAMDRNWNVDPSPPRFEFVVLRQWYREPAFIWLAALCTLAIVFLLRLHLARHFQLGRLVAARTSELTAANEQLRREIAEREEAARENRRLEEQLRQSQKMEAIGRLSGGIAHDFNNLLTVINGYASMVVSSLKEYDPAHSMVTEIAKAGERAAALVRQLLAFSRKQVLEPRILDLNTAVRDMEKMLRSLIGENIRLVTSLDPALGNIRADSGQVQQVLMNLAANARDAMRHGGELTIRTANVVLDRTPGSENPDLAPGPYVSLAVIDTGPGMDAETQARIFEPFFTTKETGRGTGLGLSTVYGIVKQSGGSISLSSAPGTGATFTIYFPRVEGAAEAQESQDAPASDQKGSETILVVEDQEEVRQITCAALSSAGYRVLEASNGEEALEIHSRHDGPIHLLLTDAVMPGISGPQLAERLKRLRPEIMILIISGYSGEMIGAPRSSDSGLAYLQKPFTPSVLTAKIRAVLGKPQGRAHNA